MFDDDHAAELALFAGLEWTEDDREVLAPLMDAAIVWADEDQLNAIAEPIVETLWDELRNDIERALDTYEKAPGDLDRARADLVLGPRRSCLARAYVKQGAIDLSGAPYVAGCCLCCAEDGLGSASAEEHEQITLDAAVAVVLRDDPEFAAGVPSDETRANARARLGELGVLATRSLPRLSAALLAIAQEPLPELNNDRLWIAATAGK